MWLYLVKLICHPADSFPFLSPSNTYTSFCDTKMTVTMFKCLLYLTSSALAVSWFHLDWSIHLRKKNHTHQNLMKNVTVTKQLIKEANTRGAVICTDKLFSTDLILCLCLSVTLCFWVSDKSNVTGDRCVWTLSQDAFLLCQNTHHPNTSDFSLTHIHTDWRGSWEVTRLRIQASWSGLQKNYRLDAGQEQAELEWAVGKGGWQVYKESRHSQLKINGGRKRHWERGLGDPDRLWPNERAGGRPRGTGGVNENAGKRSITWRVRQRVGG